MIQISRKETKPSLWICGQQQAVPKTLSVHNHYG